MKKVPKELKDRMIKQRKDVALAIKHERKRIIDSLDSAIESFNKTYDKREPFEKIFVDGVIVCLEEVKKMVKPVSKKH